MRRKSIEYYTSLRKRSWKLCTYYYILLSFLTSIKATSLPSRFSSIFPLSISFCFLVQSFAFRSCKLLQYIFVRILFFSSSALYFLFAPFWIVVGSFKLACHVFYCWCANTLCRSNGTEWKVPQRRKMILHEYFTAILYVRWWWRIMNLWALKCKTLFFEFLWIVVVVVVCVTSFSFSHAHLCALTSKLFRSITNFNVIPSTKQQANEEKEVEERKK